MVEQAGKTLLQKDFWDFFNVNNLWITLTSYTLMHRSFFDFQVKLIILIMGHELSTGYPQVIHRLRNPSRPNQPKTVRPDCAWRKFFISKECWDYHRLMTMIINNVKLYRLPITGKVLQWMLRLSPPHDDDNQ